MQNGRDERHRESVRPQGRQNVVLQPQEPTRWHTACATSRGKACRSCYRPPVRSRGTADTNSGNTRNKHQHGNSQPNELLRRRPLHTSKWHPFRSSAQKSAYGSSATCSDALNTMLVLLIPCDVQGRNKGGENHQTKPHSRH